MLPLWRLASETAGLLSAVAPAAEHKLIRTFRARQGVNSRIRRAGAGRDTHRPLIWLHAPSVGEGLQARPVLEALRREHPQWQLAYTWFSPSAERFAGRLDVDLCEVLPFDSPANADLLLDAWQPTVLAFVKLDVWPVLAERAALRGVATALVSATLASNSGRQGPLARMLLRDAYASLKAVGAISAEDAARLVQLGVHADRIRITGDTRMDQVWQRAQAVDATHPVHRLLRRERRELTTGTDATCGGSSGATSGATSDASSSAIIVVAGSTWPADEAVLLPAFLRHHAASPGTRLIIAPHEPTASHLAPILEWARAHKLPVARLSEVEASPNTPFTVLLVDRVGVLGDLYALGDVAFVGGGFHNAGLHSVLEPAAFGMPVLFGPRHANAREANDMVQRGGAFIVQDASALQTQLHRFTSDHAARTEAGAHARSIVHDGLGSTHRVVTLLESLLP